MDRISRLNQRLKRLQVSVFASLLFADDVILLAIKIALGWFGAKCEAIGMRFKSGAMDLGWKRGASVLWVGNDLLPRVKDFEYIC